MKADMVNASANNKEKKRVGSMCVNEEGRAVTAPAISWCYSVFNALLDYMGQRRFEYSEIMATRKIHAVVSSNLNSSQEQVSITNYFSK
jgi:hypothetical protein